MSNNIVNLANIVSSRTIRFVEDEMEVPAWLEGEAREEAEQEAWLASMSSRRIDDPDAALTMNEIEGKDLEFKGHIQGVAAAYAAADRAQQGFENQALRAALRLSRNDDLTPELIQSVDLKNLRKEEQIINAQTNASYFRKKLEERAFYLREFSYKAEQMQVGRLTMDAEFVQMVINLANKTKVWCEGRFNRAKPYSKRAVAALYNEAIHTLVALGKFRVAFTKKEWNSEEECSFFTKATQEDMVEVKSGSDWADELRSCYYETEDGCARTPVRGSEF